MQIELNRIRWIFVAMCYFSVSLLGETLDRHSAVLSGALPMYPPVAVEARLEGTVLLSVYVVRGVVQRVDPAPGAQSLLAWAARENVLTWKFAPDVSGTVITRFIFELDKQEAAKPSNPEIQMRLPEFVRLVVKPVRAIRTGPF